MKMKLEQSTKKSVLAILLSISPVIFVWNMELAVEAEEITDMYYIFYIWEIRPLVVYHMSMYLMFLVCWLSAYTMVRD